MRVLGCLGQPRSYRSAPEDLQSEWDSGWYHNAAAVLIEDGRVVFGAEEERVTRRKHSGKFPLEAIAACLRHRGCTLDDVDRIAFGERGGDGPYLDPRISPTQIADVLTARFAPQRSPIDRVRLVEHHLGHATSAFVPSGYPRALVFTADGFGDGISGLVAEGEDRRIVRTLAALPVRESLGRWYSSVLGYLGYGPGDEYKVMGLAPHGRADRFRAALADLFRLLPEGHFEILTQDYAELRGRLRELGPPRHPDGAFEPHHADAAAAIQESFERLVFHVLEHHRAETQHTALCLAGGTAQNSVLNGKLLASGLFERVFVQPAAHDAGIALGAALHVYLDEAPRAAWSRPADVYWGAPLPGPREVEAELARWGAFIEVREQADIAGETARRLAAGEIVGWMQGRSEFGPRALGNRSILADPRPAKHRDVVNEMVKLRESYRPFAPAVLEERLGDFFEVPRGEADLSFMTFVTPVRPEQRPVLGAVTHVDGSARVQTVSRATNPRFHELIRRFGELTGVPVLLNTSFNNNAEPIVDSVGDAIACFLTTGLGSLVIGDLLIAKRAVDAARYLELAAAPAIDVAVVRHVARDADGTAGRVVHGLVARRLRHIEISADAFAVLADDTAGARPVRILLERRSEAAGLRLGRELHLLWSLRLIRLAPPA